MKYKLINKTTGEEHICDKVVIDGWDYYVSENYKDGDYVILPTSLSLAKCVNGTTFIEGTQKVIATNNPSIDIPKVVDEVEIMANLYCKEMDRLAEPHDFNSFKYAHNKSQETHPFSEEDMIEFLDFSKSTNQEKSIYEARCLLSGKHIESKELLQLWKEQRTKTLYYE